MVAKRRMRRYAEHGWLKIKNPRYTQTEGPHDTFTRFHEGSCAAFTVERLNRSLLLRKAIWTLLARQCVPCNLHVGTCKQCLEFSPSLHTRCCNTFPRLHCKNRRDVHIFYYQPLGLLFDKPKQ